MSNLTDIITTKAQLRELYPEVAMACIGRLAGAGLIVDSIDMAAELHIDWYDEMFNESSLGGLATIKGIKYDFEYDIDFNTLISIQVAPPIDPDDEDAVAEAEENQPYSLFPEEGEL